MIEKREGPSGMSRRQFLNRSLKVSLDTLASVALVGVGLVGAARAIARNPESTDEKVQSIGTNPNALVTRSTQLEISRPLLDKVSTRREALGLSTFSLGQSVVTLGGIALLFARMYLEEAEKPKTERR